MAEACQKGDLTIKINQINCSALAYLGDAVIELMVRHKILTTANVSAGKLNIMAREYVTAHAQSTAVENILNILTEEELCLYKRGRNMNNGSVPKNASTVEYRRATGLEVLFAALYLDGKTDRLNELFAIAFKN